MNQQYLKLDYLLSELKENSPYFDASRKYSLPWNSSVKESRKTKIAWLEKFIKKRNAQFAWNLVKLENSIDSENCLLALKYKDISNLKSIIKKSPAFKKCQKALAKREKLFINKDNFDSSIKCTHPTLENTIPKYCWGCSNIPEYKTDWNNVEELKKDIKLVEDKIFIKNYYLY